MINKPPPFKGLNIRIPIIFPNKGRGFIPKPQTPRSGKISRQRSLDNSYRPHPNPPQAVVSSFGFRMCLHMDKLLKP